MRKIVITLLLAVASTAGAVIASGSADANTAEGWQPWGFPLDDYVPWSLQFDRKIIADSDGTYLVIFGYLVASPNSLTLFPGEEASRSGRIDGALVLARDDSPALRWLFSEGRSEGYYALGGVFSRAKKGPILGHLTKVRFAMKREPNQPSVTAPAGQEPRQP